VSLSLVCFAAEQQIYQTDPQTIQRCSCSLFLITFELIARKQEDLAVNGHVLHMTLWNSTKIMQIGAGILK